MQARAIQIVQDAAFRDALLGLTRPITDIFFAVDCSEGARCVVICLAAERVRCLRLENSTIFGGLVHVGGRSDFGCEQGCEADSRIVEHQN